MKYRNLSILLWVSSFILMVSAAYYQRTTGPSYPVRGKTTIDNTEIKYKLIRTWEGETDARVSIEVEDPSITGSYIYKRYKSHDDWTQADMIRESGELVAYLPGQQAAGKVEYKLLLKKGTTQVRLEEENIVLRYKGAVPMAVLIPHIIIIFLAMMFSTRTGFEAIIKGKNLVSYSLWTVILLLVGGMIFGPIVQKYAFDAFWTGWPFGQDLTDNKTLAAFILWVAAYFSVKNNPKKRGWVIAAAIVLIAIYIIPHSMMGSEIDYTQQ